MFQRKAVQNITPAPPQEVKDFRRQEPAQPDRNAQVRQEPNRGSERDTRRETPKITSNDGGRDSWNNKQDRPLPTTTTTTTARRNETRFPNRNQQFPNRNPQFPNSNDDERRYDRSENQPPSSNPNRVESEAVKFIKTYSALNGQLKSPAEIYRLITTLQNLMTQHKIRKEDPHANEIIHIQRQLLDAHEKMGNRSMRILITPEAMARYNRL